MTQDSQLFTDRMFEGSFYKPITPTGPVRIRTTETSVSVSGARSVEFNGRLIQVPAGEQVNFPLLPNPNFYTPPKEKQVFEIKAVKTIGGWVGQVHHNAEVVWESSRIRGDIDKASGDARKHLNNKIKELFA